MFKMKAVPLGAETKRKQDPLLVVFFIFMCRGFEDSIVSSKAVAKSV